jgi:soluble lytic murein transglycosylase-like protein
MMINIAPKKTLSISLFAFLFSIDSQAASVSKGYSEETLAKNQVPHLSGNKQYIPLPTVAPDRSIAATSAINSQGVMNPVIDGQNGLQTFRKASYSVQNQVSPKQISDQSIQVMQQQQPVQDQNTLQQQQQFKALDKQTPVIQSPKAQEKSSSFLGGYQLKNKPYFYQCFHASAQKYRVPVDLLLAIAQTESSFKPNAVGKNKGSNTEDVGVMQINTSWLPKLGREFGLKRHHLYEPCTNIDVGAWVLAHNFVQFGYTWNAVGAYNAKSPDKRVIYVRKVTKNLEKLRRGEL